MSNMGEKIHLQYRGRFSSHVNHMRTSAPFTALPLWSEDYSRNLLQQINYPQNKVKTENVTVVASAHSQLVNRSLCPACSVAPLNTLLTSWQYVSHLQKDLRYIWEHGEFFLCFFSKISVGCCALSKALPRMRMY